jgi:predicted alpha/beta hydrolase family esterase
MRDLNDWESAHGAQVLMVPGVNNSGRDHWQSIWERETPWFDRVDLGLWERPVRNVWVTRLNQAISRTRAPVILCAHSLGCLAVAWWAALEGQVYGWPVAGALLVAPPNVSSAAANQSLSGFGPTPKVILPFPTILVASRNDPHADFHHSRQLAELWGAHFVDAGPLGHINAQSALGNWPEGRALLDALIDGQTAPRFNSGHDALRPLHLQPLVTGNSQ